jgi:hypothetical protein
MEISARALVEAPDSNSTPQTLSLCNQPRLRQHSDGMRRVSAQPSKSYNLTYAECTESLQSATRATL